jgi:dihydroflavonol-4-reductase
MRVFVTGATGFVGPHVVHALRKSGHTVRALLLEGEQAPEGVEVVVGDLTDSGSLAGLLQDCGAVVHLAGVVGYGRSWAACRAVNVGGTRHLAEEAVRAGVSCFVHMSSVAVYGRVSGVPLTEEAPLRPIGDPYGDTKIEAERVVAEVCGAMRTVLIRPTVLYGPGDQLFLPAVLARLASGRARALGTGRQRVDLVHVRDVADFVALAVHKEAIEGPYNLADPHTPGWADFLAQLANLAGAPQPGRPLPYPVAMTAAALSEGVARYTGRPPALTRYAVRVVGRAYDYRPERAMAAGFQPRVPLLEGLAEAVSGDAKRGL